MNLQLSPSQLLSLYELIVSSLSSNMDSKTSIDLKEVRQKLNELILQCLDEKYSSENRTKFSMWTKREQDKILSLKNDLQKIKISEINVK